MFLLASKLLRHYHKTNLYAVKNSVKVKDAASGNKYRESIPILEAKVAMDPKFPQKSTIMNSAFNRFHKGTVNCFKTKVLLT